MGLGERLLNFLVNIDRAAASLFGSRWWETISGNAGRAADSGKWWGKPARAAINILLFNSNHCQKQVAFEASVAKALGQTP